MRSRFGIDFRSELPFGGRPSVAWALQALAGFGEPIVVGGPAGLSSRQVEGGNHFVDSVRRGLEAVQTEKFLLATADLPFLEAESVEDFVARSPEVADIAYPIIPIAACERAFPGIPRTTLGLREGRFTSGNLGLIRRSAMLSAVTVLERAYDARKSPLKLAQIVGWGTLGRVILGKIAPKTLPIAALEASVGRFLGVSISAVITEHADIAADIDSLEQYDQAVALWKRGE